MYVFFPSVHDPIKEAMPLTWHVACGQEISTHYLVYVVFGSRPLLVFVPSHL